MVLENCQRLAFECVEFDSKKDGERLLGSLVSAMTTTITWMTVPCENKKVIQENTYHAGRDRCTVLMWCGQVYHIRMYDIKAGRAALEGEGRTIFFC